VNPFDVAVLHGYAKDTMENRFPLIPGMDASGIVDAVGAGVTDRAVGDEVFGGVGKPYLGEGALAELVTMSSGTVTRKPTSLDHAAAAAIPVAGVTALTMADATAVGEGDVIVVIGATGGVGGYLVQIAAKRGAQVVAVCSGGNADYARSLGASEVIDYAAGDVVEAVRERYPDGLAAVADVHGDKEEVARLAEQVRSGGHVSSAVGSADEEALGARGVDGTNVFGKVSTAALDTLVGMLERGELVLPELHSFPLGEASEAFAAISSGHTRGKIVVVPA
jgi:NADPH:quinone reductase-like Zn-dependent oxidoreductase